MKSTRRISLGCSALLASSLVGISTPSHSQETCRSQLSEIKQDIEGRLGAKILSLQKTANQNSPFGDAKIELSIRLGSATNSGITPSQSRAGENIINSPSLTKTYSQRIISSCADVASVVFRAYEYNQGWALQPGGQLQEMKCVDPNRDNYYAWGEMGCL